MRPNTLRSLIAENKPIVGGWLSIASSYLAEGAGHAGYDCVTVDLQHGMLDFSDAVSLLQAISSTPAIPLVRCPSLNESEIMHLLDAGAYGVICPMISTADDARALVSACRYPPHGRRSFGPARGKLYGGGDYFSHANDELLVIPMIETSDALANIDEILAVPGVDMAYIGPNDLSLDLGEMPSAELKDSKTSKAIAHILEHCKSAGIPAGIFCGSPELARQRIAEGFALVTPGNDFTLATQAMANAVMRSSGT